MGVYCRAMKNKIFILIFGILLVVGISGAGFSIDILEEFIEAGAELIGIGIIQFGEGDYNIGNLIGEGLEKEDISVSNVRVEKEEEISTIDFLGDDGSVRIKENLYENVEEGSSIKLDNEGNMKEAYLKVGEGGSSFIFDGEPYHIPEGGIIEYKNGEITVEEVDSFEFGDKESNEVTKVNLLGESIKVKNVGGNYIITGNSKIGNNDIWGIGDNLGRVTVSRNGELLEVWGNTIATIKGVECSVFQDNVKISYDEDFNLLNCQGNCLNLRKNSIELSGKDFSVSLQEGNEIFQEFGKVYDYPSESRLDFTPNGGSLKIERISEKGQPLALLVDMEGKVDIINGQWHLKTDGEDIYARITKGVICSLPFRSLEGAIQSEEMPDCIFETPQPSDMRIKYSGSETGHKIYDLDVKSEYYEKLSEQEIRRIEEEISNLNVLKEQTERERNSILEDPFVRELLAERQRLDEALNILVEEEPGVFTFNKKVQESLDEINGNPNMLRINKVDNYLRDVEYDLDLFNSQLRGTYTFGGFGEVILANDGDVKVGYTESAQIVQNAKIYYLTGEEFATLDKVVLNEEQSSELRECADAVIGMKLGYEYERLNEEQDSIKFTLANDKEIQYNLDGTYSFWNGNEVMTKKNKDLDKGFNEWLNNVFAYSNTGSLTKNLMPMNDINDLQPGDVLTLHPDPLTGFGHTMVLMEILEIPPGSGNRHYRIGGSTSPALKDMRIYTYLWNKQDFIDQITSGELQLLRWAET